MNVILWQNLFSYLTTNNSLFSQVRVAMVMLGDVVANKSFGDNVSENKRFAFDKHRELEYA